MNNIGRKTIDGNATPALKRLQMLRNIGPKMARDLLSLGIESPEQMLEADPEALYEELKHRNGGRLDRCVLYAFRGAKHGIPWPTCKDPFTHPDDGMLTLAPAPCSRPA